MVELIEKTRLLMAEQKYIEAQQLIEKTLRIQKSDELLGLLLEIHLLQGIPLPYDLTLEFIGLSKDPHRSLELIQNLVEKSIESRILEIKLYVELGDLEEVYKKISELYIFLFERKIPRVFEEVVTLRKKYFASDFSLELKEFALCFDRGWNPELEDELRCLIQDTFQKFNTKNKNERFNLLEKIVASFNPNNSLRIYEHLLSLYNNGIENKKDYKKIIELVLYFEDLSFMAIVLNLLDKLGLIEASQQYANFLRQHKDYSFIHFEKYYPHLKRYFVSAKPIQGEEISPAVEIDLTLEESEVEDASVLDWEDNSGESSDLELSEGLKHLEYDISGWLNLSVGFLQSDFNKSALLCARKVKTYSVNDTDFLKGSYLAVHALMKLKDYRLALDYCYEALEKCNLETDVLSFSYLEVELLIQLGERVAAKKVLDNVMAIDSSYRLSAKMLKRLNEI